jgi:type III secretion protein D
MDSAGSLTSVVTGWLAKLASGRRVALAQGAERFAALISSESELEVGRAETAENVGVPATLSVETGLHAGACLQLVAGQYVIGCAPECDIVLRDSHVAEQHCKLIRGWAGFSVRDVRSKPAILVAPKEVKYDGGSIEASYEVGGLRFLVRQPAPAGISQGASGGGNAAKPRVAVMILISGVLVAAVCAAAMEQGKRSGVGAGAQPAAVPGSGLDANKASHLIEQARLALADTRIKVELHDGRLLVEGTTSETALKARIEALATDLRNTIRIEDRVNYVGASVSPEGPEPLPIRVQSVMLGQPGYFITDNGARYFVGGVLPDGAEVVAIDADQIQFKRAGQTIVYKLQ